MNRKTVRKIGEKLIEKTITLSGTITSIVILFICFFLFKEGIGLFQQPSIEKGYGLYVHRDNKVIPPSPEKVKKIVDGEIDNWQQLGGTNDSIKLYRIDDIISIYSESEMGEDYALLPSILEKFIVENRNSLVYFPIEFAPTSSKYVRELEMGKIQAFDFFSGKEWLPTATPSPLFGAYPLIVGTLFVSFLALLIAVPLGLGVAVYLSELASNRQRQILKPIIELLAGIPSVVYGFFGLVVVAPFIQKVANIPVGETALTGSIILAIMALPTIISVAEDAMRNTPKSIKEASLALGATHWQTIYKVIIPHSKSGISAAIVLGMGRAIGETMAVLMVTGNAAIIPHSAFDSVRTIPATIAAELGEAPTGGAHYQSLFLLGCILFIITMSIALVSEFITKKPTKSH
jgi:phosphate transport system permease protein